MVNRLSSSFASVISGTTNYQNLVDKDLTNSVSMTGVVNAAVGAEPYITVRDMAHSYAAGTTAGFVVQIDQKQLLGLKVVGLPFKIFFYYKGNFQESIDCQQVHGSGSFLSLNVINVSGDNATFEVTAQSTKPFDEVGICAVEGVNATVLNTTSLYYAFVGKNGKYYLTTSGSSFPYDSDNDNSTNGIKAYKEATHFDGNITLGQWPVGWPDKHVAMINSRTDDYDIIAISGERDVCATTADGKMPFKAGMRAGIEIMKIEALKALTVSGVHLYQYRPDGSSSNENSDESGKDGHDQTWTDVTPTESKNFQFLSVNLGFGKQDMSVTADKDFNAIGIKNVGIDLGVINAYRAFVELPTEVLDDEEPLAISADRSLCDEKQEVTLHSDVPVKWSCSDAHGSKLIYSPNDYATECTVSGITHAGQYIFTATAKDGRTATTKVTNGISRIYNLGMKPWVNNFTERDDKGNMIHYTSNMKEYQKKYDIFSAALLPIGGIADTANIVTPSLDDHATYVGGVEVANDKMIAGVYRSEPVTLTEPTIVGFVTRARWSAVGVKLLNGLSVKIFNGGLDITPQNTASANNNFKVLAATVIGGESQATTEYTLEIDASKSNPVTFDAITLWNKGLLELDISAVDIIDAFTETAEDANNYQQRLDESGEMVSHYTTGTRIDESLMNGGKGVEVAQICKNLTSIIDGQSNTFMSFEAPVAVASFVPIPIKLGRRYDAGHQIKLIYSADNALGVKVGQAINLETYLNGVSTQETKKNFQVVEASVIGGSDKNEIVWTPTKDFDEIVIYLAGVADVNKNYQIYGIRIENDADKDGIPDDEDDQSCDNSFLVDEYETEETLKKSHDFVNGCMNLRREMVLKKGNSSQWFNICLPVNLSFNQFVSTFGNKAELAKPDNFEEGKARYLHFSMPYVFGDNTLLQAGVPYIIKLTDTSNFTDKDIEEAIIKEMSNNDPSASQKVYKVYGVDFLMDGNWKNTTTILCSQPTQNVGNAGNVNWYGGYYKDQKISKGSYIFNDGVLTRLGIDVDKVLGLRSWMHEIDDTNNSKYEGMSINGSIIDDTTTGIHQINAYKGDYHVYNLLGMRINGNSSKLPAGIYIINGKKIIIK